MGGWKVKEVLEKESELEKISLSEKCGVYFIIKEHEKNKHSKNEWDKMNNCRKAFGGEHWLKSEKLSRKEINHEFVDDEKNIFK